MNFKRAFIEKKLDYNSERLDLLKEFREYLGIESLEDLRVINIYDLVNISKEDHDHLVENVLFDENLDNYYSEIDIDEGDLYFRVEFVKGQFNKREDGLKEIIRTVYLRDDIEVKNSKLLVFKGINQAELERIKSYYINPVELREIGLEDFSYEERKPSQKKTDYIENFNKMTEEELETFKEDFSIGLDLEDLLFCQDYFKSEDKTPSITEIKLIDTYWSDHCRHTTFMSELKTIEFEEGSYRELIEGAFKEYLASRDFVYGEKEKPICLMDLAILNAKEAKKNGNLDNQEESEEVNAASIEVEIEVDSRKEKWLLMFKNETHNHPTEIEPFGGASTCLGGAIRDPLSGRSYVYQAMRITGAKNPLEDFDQTLQGKLPQRKISKEAMKGYSSYGNEIGVPAGYLREIYDDGYVAKRMEVGALVAAAPKENVIREIPQAGDKIVLVGGRTGKDGLGGAVGSSKGHTEDSLEEGGLEVQKGNPKLERKIMRLFRKKEVSRMIKMCNDFGAGGVSVAIGELADGLLIDLDKVTTKYEGMTGTEIALSESQERMAVVLDDKDVEAFLQAAIEEDLEANVVAEVKEENRLKINFKGEDIVDLSRSFLDTNGVRKKAKVKVVNPEERKYFQEEGQAIEGDSLKEKWISNMKDLNIVSQKSLIEKFDQTVGAGTVLMPLGGKNRLTPVEGMVSKFPVLEGETRNVSMMTYGFDPNISKWSPFHGGIYSVVEATAKMVALGGDYRKMRFSFQEYFERLEDNKEKWGKPFSALLGAFLINKELGLASIGGKDSMSGSFEDIDVPPTIIAFGVGHDLEDKILSPEFKKVDSRVVLVETKIDHKGMIDIDGLKKNYGDIKRLVDQGKVLSASSVKYGGVSRSISEMALGNSIGFEFEDGFDRFFQPLYGSIILELASDDLGDLDFIELGRTIEEEKIVFASEELEFTSFPEDYFSKLEGVFNKSHRKEVKELDLVKEEKTYKSNLSLDKPKVLIPIFTGSNGEYDMARSFERAGGQVEYFVFKAMTKELAEASYLEFARKIRETNILALADGMVVSNEPEAGARLLKNILREAGVRSAIEELLEERDGLILGIGEGFDALLQTGLLPFGKILDDKDLPSLASNIDGGHKSSIESYRIINKSSAWLSYKELGEIEEAPFSRTYGRLALSERILDLVMKENLVVSQFSQDISGDGYGIEAMVSRDGRILGRLTNSERLASGLYKNIGEFKDDSIFKAGIDYFRK